MGVGGGVLSQVAERVLCVGASSLLHTHRLTRGSFSHRRPVVHPFPCGTPQAWLSYAKLEMRAGEVERARAIYERYVANHPTQTAFIRYAKWELRNQQRGLTRAVFERALEELEDVRGPVMGWGVTVVVGPCGHIHEMPVCAGVCVWGGGGQWRLWQGLRPSQRVHRAAVCAA
jgi:hypothetical protein